MMDHAVIDQSVTPRVSNRRLLADIPTDARLPQLPIILDQEAMSEILQQRLQDSIGSRDQLAVRQCEILQVRYKPESSCMVSYRLDIEKEATGERAEQILCGRALPQGSSRSQWEKACQRALVQPRFGKPLLHVPEVEMVLWTFPNDRKIHTLPAMIQLTHNISQSLPQWLVAHVGEEWRVTDTNSRVMHYVGEHTCTVRTTLEVQHRTGDTHRRISIYGKTYYDNEGAHTDHVMRELWSSEARRSGRLCMAEPLWYDARLKTLWQLGIHGTTLERDAIEGSNSSLLFVEAGHAVAALHATSVSQLQAITVPNLVKKLAVVGSLLAQHQPFSRPILVPLLSRLTAQAAMIPIHPTATLHGDLHLKNLFLTDGTIALIDLDNVCQGPPGWDIGSFVAGLLTGTLANHGSSSRTVSHVQLFLDHYHRSVAWTIDTPTIAWFTAVALVAERSYRCITRLKDNQRGLLNGLLRLADEISKGQSLGVVTCENSDAIMRSVKP